MHSKNNTKDDLSLLLASAAVMLFGAWYLYGYYFQWGAHMRITDTSTTLRAQELQKLQQTLDDPVETTEEAELRLKALENLQKNFGSGTVSASNVDLENLHKELQ